MPKDQRWAGFLCGGNVIVMACLVAWVDMRTGLGEERPPARRIEGAGVANFYRLGERLYSGAQPDPDEGFETLSRLGIRTVISVDGMVPDVASARAHGMRYVHVPIGYDGVGPSEVARLTNALRSLPGPIYVHCHHGKHRGPTAAALGAMATEGWDVGLALAWLSEAGTSSRYPGLFESVRSFHIPTAEELSNASDLPEVVPAPPLVEAMVRIDEVWEHLGFAKEVGFGRHSDHPDLVPSREATLLAEHYREVRRGEEASLRGEDFAKRLALAAETAEGLSRALSKIEGGEEGRVARDASRLYEAVERDCTGCHARHRNT